MQICFCYKNHTGKQAEKVVAVLFKNNFEHKIRNILKDDEGRYIFTDIGILNFNRLTLANLYAPGSSGVV